MTACRAPTPARRGRVQLPVRGEDDDTRGVNTYADGGIGQQLHSLHNLSHQAHRDVLLYKEPVFLVAGVVEVTGCMPKNPSTASIHGCQCGCRCDSLWKGMPMPPPVC